MVDRNAQVVQTVIISAAIGGFVFMAIAGWFLAFDLSSIATLISGSAANSLMPGLLIGGSLTKGVTVGAAFGLVLAASSSRIERKAPAGAPAPRLS